jgi:hypothetical protein
MRVVNLTLYSRNFVLYSEFLTLQFGDFLVGRGGVREDIREFRFQGFMFGCQLTEVSLK